MSRARTRKRDEKTIVKIMPKNFSTYSNTSEMLGIQWDINHGYFVSEEKRRRYAEWKEQQEAKKNEPSTEKSSE